MRSLLTVVLLGGLLAACQAPESQEALTCSAILAQQEDAMMSEWNLDEGSAEAKTLLQKYTPFRLTTDLSKLSEGDCRMLPLLMEAATAMEDIFWMQAYGDRDELLASIDDPGLRTFARINYGPWDRIDGNRPFVDGIGQKPAGGNLYPPNMTKEEFDAAAVTNPELASLYTLVRRDANERLEPIPYHVAFADQMVKAAGLLEAAAQLADDPGLRRYLTLRAEALRTGEYRASDMAWMEMKDNTIDIVIGPIESYEDGLYGAKTGAEAYVLVKDQEWSARLSRYAELLPMLQRALPVDDAYKQESPGSDSDLNAYDVLYYAGDSNAGSKTIAINLPNDETVQLEKGTRRLQLKNAMRAKFDKILEPIAQVLIAEDQRQQVTFDAFFGNTMFHEVAHGLGVKNTITGGGTVRAALQEHASALEEGKADILGLFMVSQLIESGEFEADLQDHYATFLAGIFRSTRFGASSAHGRANMIRFNYFREMGAFSRDAETGTYRYDSERMGEAMNSLSNLILTLQGDGNYAGVAELVDKYGMVGFELQSDLDRLSEAGIPVDIVFEQGIGALQE